MIEQIFLHQKAYALQLRKESIDTRFEHLDSLEKMIEKNIAEITAALAQDFKKPEAETLITEVFPVLHEIRHAKKHLRKWARPKKVRTPLLLTGTKNQIYHEPRGVCLIIGPWNYPFQLLICPLVAAIAAGNCIFLKPSEFTPQTSHLVAKLIKETFSEEHITVVEGGPEKTQDLLLLPFDHIFFTGSTRVGKIVMEAASKHLSSVTLELGGKSPTIIDSSANLKDAAEKIAWGKFVNAAQTCVAPDYLLVQQSVLSEFKKELISKVDGFYGKSALEKKNSPDLARIISGKHAERLKHLIDDAIATNAEVTYGGEVDLASHYVAPTLIEKVDPHSAVMKEEIFGPLLPIITYNEISEAIHFINERPKPLALYIYSHSEMNIQDVLKQTTAGGVCINDSVIHFSNPHLPFGGVGESGLGSYHGVYGFKAFSHEKAVLRQSWMGKMLRLIYPPYTTQKLNLFKTALRWRLF
ncbi:aldehyde dehydrogenase family protein [Bdellovibrio sp. HCB-162]|uniref:aldehyde dehydrogenase family protein n=1 Tax=Bdellovibrio sp. HCB-162 TaxID=3394234 RepID=UPI0039BCEAB7